MNIIYLHQYFRFPDETGGTRSYDLAVSFVRAGYRVTVVTATSNKKYKSVRKWTVIEREGIVVNYIYLPYGNHLSYPQRLFVFFRFLWVSSFRLLRLKADIVLATSTPLTIGIPALIKKWYSKTPFVFEVRDVWPEAVIAIGVVENRVLQIILYSLENLIYRAASAIVPLSTDMQKSIVRRFPEFASKSEIVIENISEIERFQGSADKVDLAEKIGFYPRFSVLYAGTFGKVNGLSYLIRLASESLVLDKSIVFILVGSGAEKPNVVKLAQDLNVLNVNVFILDPIVKSELPLWYRAVSMGASFVVDIPELWANSANKFFDTIAAGKPILINYEGWQAKVIRDSNIGFVLPFSLTKEGIEKFVDYSKDPDVYKTQSKNALSLAQNRYSLQVSSNKYLKLFLKVIRERS